ncbi:MAG TPA: hypothetical protein VHQ65_09655 [Thermoanaerobaculia bacterium]|nr:hypothetical protein [Thermoanaerobaculia bacterium]
MLSKRASLICLLLLSMVTGGCASGGSDEPVAVDPDRRFRVQMDWADQSETLDLREGETATVERADATYTVTPSVAGAPAGKAVVLVVRSGLGVQGGDMQQVQARLLLSEGDRMELSQTLGTPWPELTVRLERVRPRLQGGELPSARDMRVGS